MKPLAILAGASYLAMVVFTAGTINGYAKYCWKEHDSADLVMGALFALVWPVTLPLSLHTSDGEFHWSLSDQSDEISRFLDGDPACQRTW
jgi:hypothetical protein